MANIIVLGAKVPFTRGGQDVLVGTLVTELKSRGHVVDTIEIPFSPTPKAGLLNQAALWRTLDLTEFSGKKVDLVIATKFPTYFAQFPRKSLWLVHQHRPAYDLYGSRFSDLSDDPRDEELRRLLYDGDRKSIAECRYRGAISKTVSERLSQYLSLDSEPLYPPLPLGSQYRSEKSEDYILSVGRICTIKRVDMIVKALPVVHNFVKLKIAGLADEPGVMDYLQNEIAKHHLEPRVEFLGRVSDEELLALYSKALCVYYAPHNEDYGYVTLEAFASGRPVVTAHDSGGVLEFVRHEENGLILEPNSDAIGHGINRLVENKAWAETLGINARSWIESEKLLTAGWDHVIKRLLSPLVDE
jgi:glycosyltransferase involved in cell wall biosynthesis